MYDTFDVKDICRGCADITNWRINKDYPLCPYCMKHLFNDVKLLKEHGHINHMGVEVNITGTWEED